MKQLFEFDRTLSRKRVALMFVLVLAVLGFVQAVHGHDGIAEKGNTTLPDSHCTFCVASHSVAVITSVSLTPALASQSGTLLVGEPQLQSNLLVFFSLIRPPPSAA
jgi:hypothetical protein